jgi:hypothetical protein
MQCIYADYYILSAYLQPRYPHWADHCGRSDWLIRLVATCMRQLPLEVNCSKNLHSALNIFRQREQPISNAHRRLRTCRVSWKNLKTHQTRTRCAQYSAMTCIKATHIPGERKRDICTIALQPSPHPTPASHKPQPTPPQCTSPLSPSSLRLCSPLPSSQPPLRLPTSTRPLKLVAGASLMAVSGTSPTSLL